mmetsp:Transcript_77663/g.154071  ORF Transcript_77663/g.154071 Transcript_77663/m.154071 type:complete len:604 (+) Transcript_77663:80-1891(+)
MEAELSEHSRRLHQFFCEWAARQDEILARGLGCQGESCAQAIANSPRIVPLCKSSFLASANEDASVLRCHLEQSATRSGPALPREFCSEGDADNLQLEAGCAVGSALRPTGRVHNPESSDAAPEGKPNGQCARNQGTDSIDLNRHKSKMLLEHSAVLNAQKSVPLHKRHRTFLRWLGRSLHELNASCEERWKLALMIRVEESSAFNMLSALVIISNAFCMASAANHEMDNIDGQESAIFAHLELLFLCLYTVEIMVRVLAKKILFFSFAWGWFDVSIVGIGWIEVASSSTMNLNQVRMVRVLKMVRVMRVLRLLRSSREVRLLLNSLMGSVRPLLWTIAMITVIDFMFGICFVRSVAGFRHDIRVSQQESGSSDPRLVANEELSELLYSHWASVLQAMYTLHKVSTGGLNWGIVADALLHTGWQNLVIFLLYITLFMFVLTNAVTAIFCSCADEFANRDITTIVDDQLKRKKQYVKSVYAVFSDMDKNRDDVVSKAEFLGKLNDPRLLEFAKSLDIDPMDLEQFFDIVSEWGKIDVDLDTFVDGCMRLRGAARSMDIYELLMKQNLLGKEMSCLQRQTYATHKLLGSWEPAPRRMMFHGRWRV